MWLVESLVCTLFYACLGPVNRHTKCISLVSENQLCVQPCEKQKRELDKRRKGTRTITKHRLTSVLSSLVDEHKILIISLLLQLQFYWWNRKLSIHKLTPLESLGKLRSFSFRAICSLISSSFNSLIELPYSGLNWIPWISLHCFRLMLLNNMLRTRGMMPGSFFEPVKSRSQLDIQYWDKGESWYTNLYWKSEESIQVNIRDHT